MAIKQDFDGEIYEIDVKLEDKKNLRHIAHYPIKSGPETFKSVNIFGIKASTSGKKIVSFWKSRLAGPGKLNVEEETQFECQPDELERLVALLDNLEEVTELKRGKHIILRKDSPSTQAAVAAVESIKNTDSSEVEDLMIKLIESISDVEANVDDLSKISNSLTDKALHVENLIGHARTQKVVSKFKSLVEENRKEQKYQDFLEEHPWLFGNRYIDKSETRKLTRDEEVDFCLETISGYYDVFEIKRPGDSVVNYDASHDTYYASADLSKAVSQVENYIKEIDASRDEIFRRDKMDVLKPRGTVVIGSNLSTEEREGLQVFNSYLNRVRVMTYSEIVSMGERLIDMYSPESTSTGLKEITMD